LIGAEYDNQADETYEYDETGNRTNYEIGANNQILSDGVYNYTYDAEGNRISKINTDPNITDTTTYAWDHRNRLITVTIITDTNTTVVNYRYDYLNRLISRTVEQTETTQTTTQHFIHDGNQLILEFIDNELSQRHFWGAETDELLAVDNLIDDETLWVLADHLNSTRNILRNENDQVNKIATIDYDAFGNIVSGTNPINIAYTGKYHDEITNLQWNINRWYDSNLGQWLSQDPIGFGVGDPNLYRYVGNDPIDMTDPDGLAFRDWLNYGSAIAGGTARGLKTGANGVANGLSRAAVSTVTLGYKNDAKIFTMTEEDTAYGGNISENIAAASGEILIAAGTIGVAQAAQAIQAPKVIKGISTSLAAYDAAGNGVNAGRGIYDMTQNGPTFTNTVQVGSSVVGFCINTKAFSKTIDNLPTNKLANANNDLVPKDTSKYSNITGFSGKNTSQVLSNVSNANTQRISADIGNKLEYVLGHATGRQHNLDRSRQLVDQLNKIGLYDSVKTRQYLTNHFNDVLNQNNNISKVMSNGTVIRESLLMGPNGGIMVKTTWEGNILRTVIFKGDML
jgi:RHS repeat-associated protein